MSESGGSEIGQQGAGQWNNLLTVRDGLGVTKYLRAKLSTLIIHLSLKKIRSIHSIAQEYSRSLEINQKGSSSVLTV